jgi:hypothetical protein
MKYSSWALQAKHKSKDQHYICPTPFLAMHVILVIECPNLVKIKVNENIKSRLEKKYWNVRTEGQKWPLVFLFPQR